MLFAPGTIAAKKSGFRGWALALARLDTGCALRVRRRLQAGPELPLLAGVQRAWTGTAGSGPGVSPGRWWSADTARLLVFAASVGLRPALGATVSGLGMGGTKRLLASLEQTPPLPRPTMPLDGLPACGNFDVGPRKLRTSDGQASDAEFMLRSEAPYLPTPTYVSKLRSLGLGFQATGWMPINCKPPITAWYPPGC